MVTRDCGAPATVERRIPAAEGGPGERRNLLRLAYLRVSIVDSIRLKLTHFFSTLKSIYRQNQSLT